MLAAVLILVAVSGCRGGKEPAAEGGGKERTGVAETRDRSEGEDRPAGSWWKIDADAGRDGLSDEELRKLASLGYLGGYERAPAQQGVVRFEAGDAYDGYNLVVSGHAPVAYLTDMVGTVVHRWRHRAPSAYGVPPDRNFWRRVHLLDDGGLLAIFDPFGVIRLDRESRLVWATEASDNIHHDLDVTDDGRIFTLGKRSRTIPGIHDEVEVVEDLVVELDPTSGRVVDRFSIFEAFQTSPYAEDVAAYVRHTARLGAEKGLQGVEDFHTNTIQVFDGRLAHLSPLFAKGNMIFCSPHLNNVWIIDRETRSVAWNWAGPWYRIHEPQLVDDGNLLLFHNNGYKEEDRTSQVLLYDLLSRRELWSFGWDTRREGDRFFSGTSSAVSRLPNGNTLIVVSESGRVLEVTPGKEVVWEYVNPHRAGDRDELIAAIFQLDRVPYGDVQAWLPGEAGAAREAHADT